MTSRITIKHLDALANQLNELTNSPKEYMGTDANGKSVCNIGHYTISQAYGGYCLHRIMNTGGGVNTPLCGGHIPARQLYNEMIAFIRGLEFKGN